jgi:ribonuclease BN (tRNA processing enzyme)
MEIKVVGSGTVVPRLARRQSCVAVEAGGETLLFDLGSGSVRGMLHADLDPFAVDRIFFTHFHPDHTVDVVPLLFAMKYSAEGQRTRPLHLAGPEPFRRFWKAVTNVWGEFMLGEYPIEISELPHDGRRRFLRRVRPRGGRSPSALELPGCRVSWAPVRHRPESIAYRLQTGDGAFVYTGDTEYSESVVELARGAHTMLIECSFPNDSPVPGHLTPSSAAKIATEAGVERVVLTHIFPAADELDLAAEVGCGYEGEVIVAEDGLQFSV